MNELRRMNYLEAAGIDMFVPRFVLPNASLSVQCELPAPTAVDAAKTDDGTRSVQVPVGKRELGNSAQIAALLDSSKEPAAASKTPTVSSTVTQSIDVTGASEVSSNADTQSAHFHLALWKTDTGVQVLDACHPEEALPTHQLLTNILIANQLINTQLGRQELFRWPLTNHKGPASWEDARAFMADFFDGRFQQYQARAILAFGEDACRSLFPNESDFSELLFSSRKHVQFGIPVFVLPSLKTLLYAPSEKANVWRALTSLRDT